MFDDDDWLFIMGAPSFQTWQEALGFVIFVLVVAGLMACLVHVLT